LANLAKSPEIALLSKTLHCWVLTDGKAGMESQCVGLAEKLDLTPVIKRVSPRFPWSILPPQLWIAPFSALGAAGSVLAPPWPDILIATGRQTVTLALAIKQANPSTLTVQIQNPTVDLKRFDIVIAPAHDRLTGDNVVSTAGALHGVTPQKLEDAGIAFTARYAGLKKPIIGVLIGGTNKKYRFTKENAERFASLLKEASQNSGGSLAITPSRRTGEENLQIIESALSDQPTDIWDGSGENPYFGILALADSFVVTGDSVNMVSEAVATGKPVHVFQLSGGSAKFSRFHQDLERQGKTRPFTGQIEHWEYPGADDMTLAAEAVEKAWNAHKN
jgi:mitochondrial fission protein ELM1